MNQTSIVCGVEAVKDRNISRMASEKLLRQGSGQKKNLQNLDLHIWIQVNFIFAKHPEYDAKELFEALKAHDIYVRFWAARESSNICVFPSGQEEMEQLFAF